MSYNFTNDNLFRLFVLNKLALQVESKKTLFMLDRINTAVQSQNAVSAYS